MALPGRKMSRWGRLGVPERPTTVRVRARVRVFFPGERRSFPRCFRLSRAGQGIGGRGEPRIGLLDENHAAHPRRPPVRWRSQTGRLFISTFSRLGSHLHQYERQRRVRRPRKQMLTGRRGGEEPVFRTPRTPGPVDNGVIPTVIHVASVRPCASVGSRVENCGKPSNKKNGRFST